MAKWIPLIIALVLNAGGNVLLKVGARVAARGEDATTLVSRTLNFLNAPTVCGIVLFAANVLVYRKALDSLNLSVAYPIMVSGGLVLVTTAAVMLPILKEEISWGQVLGMLLIAAGVWLVSQSSGGAG
jgi:multidrug transporter EmrE-like cation transporter